jgi:hypothetical protein
MHRQMNVSWDCGPCSALESVETGSGPGLTTNAVGYPTVPPRQRYELIVVGARRKLGQEEVGEGKSVVRSRRDVGLPAEYSVEKGAKLPVLDLHRGKSVGDPRRKEVRRKVRIVCVYSHAPHPCLNARKPIDYSLRLDLGRR